MLIRTKLLPPRNSFRFVSRSDLLDKLSASADGKLTLICAPAGFGKTTLVTTWLEQLDRPFAWLSLDENDNDFGLFASYLLAALEPLLPADQSHTSQTLGAADLPRGDDLAIAFLNDIDSVAEPFVLLLDDYHLIHDDDIHELCRTLIARLPAHVHIILITRADPPLPLPKLLIGGQATQIRTNDLRFSDGEAHEFLRLNGHEQLDADAIERLNHQLEGWIAGLRMVALSLDSVDAEATYLENLDLKPGGFVAEYLMAEVLDHLPAETRTFLLETSLLDRLCADLCDAVVTAATPGSSAEFLRFLRRSNLFLTPLDERGKWFRYHHLFQRILQQKLEAQTESQHGSFSVTYRKRRCTMRCLRTISILPFHWWKRAVTICSTVWKGARSNVGWTCCRPRSSGNAPNCWLRAPGCSIAIGDCRHWTKC